MKRFTLLLAIPFLFAYSAACAQQSSQFSRALKDTLLMAAPSYGDANSLRYYLMVTKAPSNNLSPAPSVWDTITSYFTNEKKNEKIKNFAAFLYNAYISKSLSSNGIIPAKFDFNYIGTADPLSYLLGTPNQGDLLSFYQKNKSDIRQELKKLIQTKTALSYNPQAPDNDQIEEAFIKTLLNSKDYRNHYGYVFSTKEALAEQIEASLKKELKRTQEDTVKKNKNKVVTYQHIDPMVALDNASSLARKSSSAMATTYRYVNDECALCTYTYCLNICANLTAKYQSWQIYRVYQISAYNLNDDYVLPTEGGDTFTTVKGNKRKWDYHTAALILLKKDKAMLPIVVDSFLLAEPADLNTWAQLFKTDETLYNVSPFTRNPEVEKNLLDKKNLPKNATPHPVYN